MHAPTGVSAELAARLYDQARAERWGLSSERFQAALEASLAHARAGAAGDIADADAYLSALHLEDLALAAACAAGLEPAWEYFIAQHRRGLQRAAAAIDPAGGNELADSLYAELYGLDTRTGARQSLFRYFHGRSRLATWLRAVLAQRHVDRVRSVKREEPLPDEDAGLAARNTSVETEDRPRFAAAMQSALAAAVAALPSRDRLRLACYYVEEMTLAAIGRMLNEHEATVSRHLARTRRELRAATEDCLRRVHHFDDRAVSECFQTMTQDAGALDLGEILGSVAGRKNDARNRSKR